MCFTLCGDRAIGKELRENLILMRIRDLHGADN